MIWKHRKNCDKSKSFASPTQWEILLTSNVRLALFKGISKALVSVTDTNCNVRTIRTTTFGYYRIEDLEAGEIYTLNISHKRYQFSPRVVTLGEDLNEFDFTAE